MNQVLLWIEQGTSSNPLFLYLSFFSFLLFLVVKFRTGASKYKFPPSPSKLPFIGNLHQVLHGSPHHAFRSLAQKHGPLMLLHLGRVPTLVVSSADMARDVLKTYDHVFSSRPELMIPKRLFYGKDMAFSPYGEYWRQVRKVCVLQLLCAKKVESFGFVREEEVALMIEKIKQSTLTVNLSQMLLSYTNNVVSRVALRRKYDQDEDGGKLREILKEFISLLGVYNMGDLIPSLGWLNHLNGLNTRVEKNFREIDSFLDDVIEEHLVKKRRIDDDDCENEEEDFVDVMLGIEKDSSFGIPMGRDNSKAMIMEKHIRTKLVPPLHCAQVAVRGLPGHSSKTHYLRSRINPSLCSVHSSKTHYLRSRINSSLNPSRSSRTVPRSSLLEVALTLSTHQHHFAQVVTARSRTNFEFAPTLHYGHTAVRRRVIPSTHKAGIKSSLGLVKPLQVPNIISKPFKQLVVQPQLVTVEEVNSQQRISEIYGLQDLRD